MWIGRAGIVLALTVCSSIGRADIISVEAPGSSPSVGNTFTIDISAIGVTDLYAFQFDLVFNPTLLSAGLVTEGPFLPSGGTTIFLPGTIDNIGGSITANADTLIGPIPGVTGDGILAEIQFIALAPGTSDLSLQNVILLDSTLSDITSSAAIQNGSVTISSVPEASALPLCAVAAGLIIALKQRSFKRAMKRV